MRTSASCFQRLLVGLLALAMPLCGCQLGGLLAFASFSGQADAATVCLCCCHDVAASEDPGDPGRSDKDGQRKPCCHRDAVLCSGDHDAFLDMDAEGTPIVAAAPSPARSVAPAWSLVAAGSASPWAAAPPGASTLLRLGCALRL